MRFSTLYVFHIVTILNALCDVDSYFGTMHSRKKLKRNVFCTLYICYSNILFNMCHYCTPAYKLVVERCSLSTYINLFFGNSSKRTFRFQTSSEIPCISCVCPLRVVSASIRQIAHLSKLLEVRTSTGTSPLGGEISNGARRRFLGVEEEKPTVCLHSAAFSVHSVGGRTETL